MSWRITKKAMITNKTGCEPCREISELREHVDKIAAATNVGMRDLHSRIGTISDNIGQDPSRDIVTETRYVEVKGLFTPGPISVEFTLADAFRPDEVFAVGGPANAYKFIIDNNGNGYLSLADLFTWSPPQQSSSSTQPTWAGNFKYNGLNIKIGEMLIADNKARIADGTFVPGQFNCDGSDPGAHVFSCYTIAELTIRFGKGQSYVTPPRTEIGYLGGPWGSPIFFEIGGQRYSNDGKKFTPAAQVQPLRIPFMAAEGATKGVQLRIQQVRLVGEGQSLSTISGSCIFVFYNVINDGLRGASGDATEQASFVEFAERRVVANNFLWRGHFGICTDYDTPNSDATATFAQEEVDNLQIGYDPIPQGPAGADSAPIFIPGYTGAGDQQTYRSVEFLLIDIWIELEPLAPNIVAVGDKNLPYTLGYPLLTVGATIPRRFYMKNVVCFSYQPMSTGVQSVASKGIVLLNASYVLESSLEYSLPVDTFIENCSFAARNTNTIKCATPVTPDDPCKLGNAKSLWIGNGDKVSLMTSTFHGAMEINTSKLAAYNCYSLSVNTGQSSSAKPNAVNYNIVVTPSGAAPSGYGSTKSQPRVILQNMIFVTHLDRPAVRRILGLDVDDNSVSKLTDLTKYMKKEGYKYTDETSLYPIRLGSEVGSNWVKLDIKNFFISGSTYYGIMTGGTDRPTFSALELRTANITQFEVPAPTAGLNAL